MTAPIMMTCDVHFNLKAKGRKQLRPGRERKRPANPGRVPRIAKLMALAIRFDGLIRAGVVRDYAELARLGHVTRARITQIMNMLLLAPNIQEQLLFLPRIEKGHEFIHLRLLQPIAAFLDWNKQRSRWVALLSTSSRNE
jgi:hypothetical protein